MPVLYEPFPLSYLVPARWSKYTKDFILPNGIIVETKGQFKTEDRQKHLLIKKQHPDLDIRFVFSNPRQRISKRSDTTYARWCELKGFEYAKQRIPEEWFHEPPWPSRIGALQDAGFCLEDQLDPVYVEAIKQGQL